MLYRGCKHLSGSDEVQELWSKESTHPRGGEEDCSVCAEIEDQALLHPCPHHEGVEIGCEQVHHTSHLGEVWLPLEVSSKEIDDQTKAHGKEESMGGQALKTQTSVVG